METVVKIQRLFIFVNKSVSREARVRNRSHAGAQLRSSSTAEIVLMMATIKSCIFDTYLDDRSR